MEAPLPHGARVRIVGRTGTFLPVEWTRRPAVIVGVHDFPLTQLEYDVEIEGAPGTWRVDAAEIVAIETEEARHAHAA